MSHRHPASVYRAAREGFHNLLTDIEDGDRRWPRRNGPSGDAMALAALRGVTRGLLQDLRSGFARSMSTWDLAAYVLGTSAVPAVLHVRDRRACLERIGREAQRP